MGKDRGDQHQVFKPVGIPGNLRDLREQVDVTLGINGYHRVALADILLNDVLHDPGLADPGGTKTPEMTLAVAVGKAQFQNSLGMIKVNTGSDVGSRAPAVFPLARTSWQLPDDLDLDPLFQLPVHGNDGLSRQLPRGKDNAPVAYVAFDTPKFVPFDAITKMITEQVFR